MIAYNNPIDTKTDLTPEILAELSAAGHIVAVKEFSGDPRRAYRIVELAPDLDVLIGADGHGPRDRRDRLPGLDLRLRQRVPQTCIELYKACRAGDMETAVPLYRLLHPLLRWDSKTEFVQAIKYSMDIAGRYGGPCARRGWH